MNLILKMSVHKTQTQLHIMIHFHYNLIFLIQIYINQVIYLFLEIFYELFLMILNQNINLIMKLNLIISTADLQQLILGILLIAIFLKIIQTCHL